MPEFHPVDHDPFASPQPMLMPVDHDPFGGQHPGVTMDSDLSSMDPYEAVKLRSELATRGGYTPEQATQNQAETGMGLLYATPIGNALSARDAMEAKWRAQELERQGDTEGARRAFAQAAASAGSAFLPGMGRLGRGVEGAASSTRIFAGPMAKTANHVALSRAGEMERQGLHPEEIWRATGWERHPVDGKWRFEIDDSAARMRDVQPEPIEDLRAAGVESAHPLRSGVLSDFLDHPALYDAYPELANTETSSFRGGSGLASYDPAWEKRPYPIMQFSPEVLGDKRIPLHEVQHAVQDAEGFTLGTSPNAFSPDSVAAFRASAANAANLGEQGARNRLYQRTGGEVEARNVETRADMTAEERRGRAPWLTEDTYRMLQIRAPARSADSGFENAANQQLAIKAYHGSPHDFDRFDMSRIGTGEGAQAYGHGLYFAENSETAKFYQRTLAGKGMPLKEIVEQHLGLDLPVTQTDLGHIYSAATNGDKDALQAAKAVQARLPHLRDDGVSFMAPPGENGQKIAAAIEKIRDVNRGRLYHTELDVDHHQLLDWDKPLSEQSPQVRAALEPLLQKHKPQLTYDFEGNPKATDSLTGENYYHGLAQTLGTPFDPAFPRFREKADFLAATQALREAGIPGIHYLDQGSRSAEGGTHNIVMFDDNLIKILGKE